MNWDKFKELKILIIDDDQFTRELIRTMFKEVPHIITEQARDAIEALSMIETNKYDILLLDLYMPKMNGKEFIENLKKNKKLYESLVIVLITTDRLGTRELQNIGVKHYLTKPFDFHNFLNNIYGFLEQETSLNET